jgi:hypothetical protein
MKKASGYWLLVAGQIQHVAKYALPVASNLQPEAK